MPDDDTTDPRYKQIAGAALEYARAELGDEIARLRKENAALKKQLTPAAGGHGPAGAADDGRGSPLRLALARARTLALFLGLLSCTTVILEGYEHTLAQHVSLSFFVPFLIGHGGNAGGMSVGSVIAQLAQGPVNRGRVAAREMICGLGVAAQLCALAAVVLSVLGFDHGLSVVVVLSLGGLTALSAAVGAVLLLCGSFV